jgi:hypothetical protein
MAGKMMVVVPVLVLTRGSTVVLVLRVVWCTWGVLVTTWLAAVMLGGAGAMLFWFKKLAWTGSWCLVITGLSSSFTGGSILMLSTVNMGSEDSSAEDELI